MATRKLQVEIVGDSSSFQAALRQANTAAAQFGKTVDSKLRGGSTVTVAGQFDSLLGNTRQMRQRADELSKSLTGVGVAASEGAAPGVGSLIARAGVATFAVSALYQGSRQLQEALRVTGAEAFTTGGKLRNFAASLTSGDIVGGFRALAAQPKTLQEAGISAEQASYHYDALAQAAEHADGAFGRLARQAVALVNAQRATQNAADSLADYVTRLGTAFETSTGRAVIFKGAVDDLAGLRGPGLVNQINTTLRATRRARQERAFTPVGPTAKNEAAQIVAAAQGDLPELLRLQVIARDRLQKAVNDAVHKTVQARTELNKQLAQAQAAVITTQKAITKQAQTDAESAAAARKARAADAKALREQIAEQARNARLARLAAEQARQYRAIGLSPTGQELAPTASNLQKQFQQLSKRVIGEDVPRNLRDRLARVGRLLKGDLKGITEDTRRAIKELFDTIRGTFKTETNKDKTGGVDITPTVALNTKRAIAGITGLTPQQIGQLRANLSNFNSAGLAIAPTSVSGTTTINLETTVKLDGQAVGTATKRFLLNDARHNPPQRRGPHAGR